eukprot:TRINITY_DN3076_c0_g1_i1.p1 TRINITY_DN3076_c0_g1~~TRINITY_DN3076_c0_g1_i1.p1  ORF type:complete len:404 (+),score=126.84 TRINITY_DN3076_c0_g1_i1:74-1285(+)
MPPSAHTGQGGAADNAGCEGDVSSALDSTSYSSTDVAEGLPQVYLCCDIEATCDGSVAHSPNGSVRRRFVAGYQNEVLELPVEVVDAATGAIVGDSDPSWRFHSLVRPLRKPSPFCTDFTGLDDEQLCDAPPLEIALRRLEAWLATRRLVPWPHARSSAGEVSFVWVTDGQWDFGNFLWRDCERKGLPFPFVCSRWCDARRAFSVTWPQQQLRKPVLQNMVSHAGLQWQGVPHRGFWDTHNLAALVGTIAQHNQIALLPTHGVPSELLSGSSPCCWSSALCGTPQGSGPPSPTLSPVAQQYKLLVALRQSAEPDRSTWAPSPPRPIRVRREQAVRVFPAVTHGPYTIQRPVGKRGEDWQPSAAVVRYVTLNGVPMGTSGTAVVVRAAPIQTVQPWIGIQQPRY